MSPVDWTPIVARAMLSTVALHVVSTRHVDDKCGEYRGSGFITDVNYNGCPLRVVVTNQHVAGRLIDCLAVLHDETRISLKPFARAPYCDITLMVSDDPLLQTAPALGLAADTAPKGTSIRLISNDTGALCSVAEGSVSRYFGSTEGDTLLVNTDIYQAQMGASGGASGGAAINRDGEVIGILAAGWKSSNINRLLPVYHIRDFAASIGKDYCLMPIVWYSMSLSECQRLSMPESYISEAQERKQTHFLMVGDFLDAQDPTLKLQHLDFLLEIDGQFCWTHRDAQKLLQEAVRRTMTVVRGGELLHLQIDSTPWSPSQYVIEVGDFCFSELGTLQAFQERRPPRSVVVGGTLYKKLLILVGLNGEAVSCLDDLLKVIEQTPEGGDCHADLSELDEQDALLPWRFQMARPFRRNHDSESDDWSECIPLPQPPQSPARHASSPTDEPKLIYLACQRPFCTSEYVTKSVTGGGWLMDPQQGLVIAPKLDGCNNIVVKGSSEWSAELVATDHILSFSLLRLQNYVGEALTIHISEKELALGQRLRKVRIRGAIIDHSTATVTRKALRCSTGVFYGFTTDQASFCTAVFINESGQVQAVQTDTTPIEMKYIMPSVKQMTDRGPPRYYCIPARIADLDADTASSCGLKESLAPQTRTDWPLLRIQRMFPGTESALKNGDIIVKINGRTPRDAIRETGILLEQHNVLQILRQRNVMTINFEATPLEDFAQTRAIECFGATFVSPSYEDRWASRPSSDVRIDFVHPGSPARLRDLDDDRYVTAVNDNKVQTLDDLLQALRASNSKTVMLQGLDDQSATWQATPDKGHALFPFREWKVCGQEWKEVMDGNLAVRTQ